MRPRVLRALAARDLVAVRRSRSVMLPVAIVPALLLLLIPLAMAATSHFVGESASGDVRQMLEVLPASARARVASVPTAHQPLYVMLVYLMAPIFLFAPLVVSTVLAADSFAGERERGTIETLLHTPATEAEIFLAKVLGPWSIACAVALGGFVLYSAWVDVLLWPAAGRLVLPDLSWVGLALWVAPGFSALAIGLVVLVSSRVRGVQESYQMASVVVLPVLLLVLGQVSGAVTLVPAFVALLGAAVWLLAAGVLVAGARTFRRDAILSRT